MKGSFVRIAILIIILFFPPNTFAGIRINASRLELVAVKGQETCGSINIVNEGKCTSKINIIISKFANEDKDPSGWFFTGLKTFELQPGESSTIDFMFKPPLNTEGELKARILISSNELGEGRNPIGLRFNIPVYVIIQGTVYLDANLIRVNTNYNSKNGEISGDIFLENKSNVHIRPDIKLVVKDLENNFLCNIEVPFGQTAQKETAKIFIFKEKIHLRPGKYRIIANIDYGKFYGLKDYIATKEVEFEVKPLLEEKTEEKVIEKGGV